MKSRILYIVTQYPDLSTNQIAKRLNDENGVYLESLFSRGTVSKCLSRMVKNKELLRSAQLTYRIPTMYSISPA